MCYVFYNFPGLKRIPHFSAHLGLKIIVIESFLVRPILEYGSCVWDPHYNKDIDNFEKVQKRAARFVTGNYKMETGNTRVNMNKLGWKPLQERRAGLG